MTFFRLFVGVSMSLIVAACSHAPAPVEESLVVKKMPLLQTVESHTSASAGTLAGSTGQQHKIEKGDTLYSIAFRYGMDFKTLAAINGIREPYTIYPGQMLTIKSRGQPLTPRPKPAAIGSGATPATVVKAEVDKPVAPPSAAAKPVVQASAPVAGPVSVAGKTTASVPSSSASPDPAPALAPVVPATQPAVGKSASPAVSATSASLPANKVRVVGGGSWQWPVQGALIGRFTSAGVGPKGVAIAGNAGDPVRAARDGRVVYTGSSLVGYGQLVIIKHDDVYLSAYAHNSRVMVKEGDVVKAGSVIAEMGSSGAERTKLHFEVRRNGDPIDPLSVLPLI